MCRVFSFLLISFSSLMASCANVGGATGSAIQAYLALLNRPSFQHTPLQPQFTYLEVQAPGNSALMVLAEIDELIENTEESKKQTIRHVETWVSNSGELLRTQSGFFVGSQGVKYLPELAQTIWDTGGNPVVLHLNHQLAGVNQLTLSWKPLNNLGPFADHKGDLLSRAKQVPNLNLKAWVATSNNKSHAASPRLDNHREVFQLVGTDPLTGNLVYGQYCLGPQQCIEYLLRTASSNL